MSGFIILAGGGDEHQSKKTDERFRYYVNKVGVSSTLYIPLASRSDSHDKAIEWFMSTYNFLPNTTAITNIDEVSNIFKNSFGAIYIGGGNTGVLASVLRKYGLDTYIVSQLKQGAIVYGGSAGAIILGKTIATAPNKELTISLNLDGLGVIGDYSVLPHFEAKFQQRDIKIANNYKTKLLGISEDAGVVIKDGNIIEKINPDGISEYYKLSK